MGSDVLTILFLCAATAPVAFAYGSSVQLDMVNGKKYLNRRYEVETADGTLRQVNGEIVGLISKRELSENEKRQLEKEIEEIEENTNQIMANTMNGVYETQQNIQRNINDMNEKIHNLWSNYGYYSNNDNLYNYNLPQDYYYNGYGGNNMGTVYV